MRKKIDVAGVRSTLDIICETMGDRVDKFSLVNGRPRYLAQGEPCCLVGMILAYQGFTPGLLRELDIEGRPLAWTSHPMRKRFTSDAWDLLVFLQGKNDGSVSWGEARRAAFRASSYWLKINPKFAYPGPWCTEDNVIEEKM